MPIGPSMDLVLRRREAPSKDAPDSSGGVAGAGRTILRGSCFARAPRDERWWSGRSVEPTAVLANCRHAPQFDEPEATLDAVARFCKTHLEEDR